MIATVYDTMVHYSHNRRSAHSLPPSCPNCGSHRTQIVDRSEDRRTVIVRCSSCGNRASIVVGAGSDQCACDEVVRLPVGEASIEQVVR